MFFILSQKALIFTFYRLFFTGSKQLADYQRRSNRIWKPCLGMKSPNQVVEQYLGVM